MGRIETMERYEAETGTSLEEAKERWKTSAFCSGYMEWLEAKANISDEAIKAFQKIIRNQCDEISALKEKATAYDRLMSGGKKTLKEWANIFGTYFAVNCCGYGIAFREKPYLLTEDMWFGENTRAVALIYPELIEYTGSWKDSLTFPDGWEEE